MRQQAVACPLARLYSKRLMLGCGCGCVGSLTMTMEQKTVGEIVSHVLDVDGTRQPAVADGRRILTIQYQSAPDACNVQRRRLPSNHPCSMVLPSETPEQAAHSCKAAHRPRPAPQRRARQHAEHYRLVKMRRELRPQTGFSNHWHQIKVRVLARPASG
ncbi:hypothetical protein ACJQWK_00802 [Exserohilum turcicum]